MQSFGDNVGKLDQIRKSYYRLCELLTYEEVLLDKRLCLKFTIEKQQLAPIVLKYDEYLNISREIDEIDDLLNKSISSEEKSLFEAELIDAQTKKLSLEQDIIKLLFELDAIIQNIIIEIVSSKDSISNQLMNDLTQGYTLFCKNNNLDFSVVKDKLVIRLNISGINAKKYFENEIGKHCIKKDVTLGSCNVFVYDDEPEEEIFFEEKDLEVTTCRSSGAGGQHINTTDSAIKVTHLKTGISTICQDERSQFQNKQIALERLKEKVLDYINKRDKEKLDKQKKEQLKLMKTHQFVKIYDYEFGKIITNKNTEMLIKDFINGLVL